MTARLNFLKRGFTLVELIVVIGVIGILSSIALIGLNRASASARDVQRQATMNGIRTALECYMRENGTYPTTASFNWGALSTTFGAACMTVATVNDPYKNTAVLGTGGAGTVAGSTVTYTYVSASTTTYTLTLVGETKTFPAWTNPN